MKKADQERPYGASPASQLQTCNSTGAILAVLQDQVRQAFDQTHSGDERLTKWLNPSVNVLYAFSAALGRRLGMSLHQLRVIVNIKGLSCKCFRL